MATVVWEFSMDSHLTSCQNGLKVIAEVNPNMPRTHGNTFISIDEITHLVPSEEPLMEVKPTVITDVEKQIVAIIARN